jgi:protoheme IX farnesyltransferase
VVLYASVLVPVSLAPTLVGLAGRLYFGGALVLGLIFLALSIEFARRRTNDTARRLFLGSISYLPLIWGLMLGNHL